MSHYMTSICTSLEDKRLKKVYELATADKTTPAKIIRECVDLALPSLEKAIRRKNGQKAFA